MPFRADLDRHGLEDEPEIHVRDGDAGVLPVWHGHVEVGFGASTELDHPLVVRVAAAGMVEFRGGSEPDRKSTRLNSSHVAIPYAVVCLNKKIYHGTASV